MYIAASNALRVDVTSKPIAAPNPNASFHEIKKKQTIPNEAIS